MNVLGVGAPAPTSLSSSALHFCLKVTNILPPSPIYHSRTVIAPQSWNTRKVASKLTTCSCSNAAVGEKVARRRIEPTNPHRRHGQRGRARSTAFAAREQLTN